MSKIQSSSSFDTFRPAAAPSGFAVAAVQYFTAAQQGRSRVVRSLSSAVAGVGTGAVMVIVSLTVLQLIGG